VRKKTQPGRNRVLGPNRTVSPPGNVLDSCVASCVCARFRQDSGSGRVTVLPFSSVKTRSPVSSAGPRGESERRVADSFARQTQVPGGDGPKYRQIAAADFGNICRLARICRFAGGAGTDFFCRAAANGGGNGLPRAAAEVATRPTRLAFSPCLLGLEKLKRHAIYATSFVFFAGFVVNTARDHGGFRNHFTTKPAKNTKSWFHDAGSATRPTALRISHLKPPPRTTSGSLFLHRFAGGTLVWRRRAGAGGVFSQFPFINCAD